MNTNYELFCLCTMGWGETIYYMPLHSGVGEQPTDHNTDSYNNYPNISSATIRISSWGSRYTGHTTLESLSEPSYNSTTTTLT